MFDILKKIFSDDNGNLSLMRIMSFGCFLMALFLQIYSVINECKDIYNLQIVEWLGFAFAGKVGQKIIEK